MPWNGPEPPLTSEKCESSGFMYTTCLMALDHVIPGRAPVESRRKQLFKSEFRVTTGHRQEEEEEEEEGEDGVCSVALSTG